MLKTAPPSLLFFGYHIGQFLKVHLQEAFLIFTQYYYIKGIYFSKTKHIPSISYKTSVHRFKTICSLNFGFDFSLFIEKLVT